VPGLRERASAAVIGLAVGDALGAPFVSRRANEIRSAHPALDAAPAGRPVGSWTGRTEMARNLCRSLIERAGELDLDDVLRRHLEWFRSSRSHADNQTSLALAEADRGTPQAARAVFERRGPEVSAGNGSVAYCAPLGIVRARTPDRLADEAPALCALTHWDERCRTACLAVTSAVAALVRGEDEHEAVISAVGSVAARDGGDELEFLIDAVGKARPVDGPDQGFTLFCAATGLHAVTERMTFDEGLARVVSLGGDTAANGAVAGALLGARHGADAIPASWLGGLPDLGDLTREATALASLV
jgi:ADP-ribosyl-[dinitrogen reductase] hydrolase